MKTNPRIIKESVTIGIFGCGTRVRGLLSSKPDIRDRSAVDMIGDSDTCAGRSLVKRRVLWMAGMGLALAVVTARGGGLEYRTEMRTTPRPLQIHVLQVDLADKTQDLAVAVGDDPDAGGPAEAQLVQPWKLAAQAHLVAAVNANAWGNLSAAPGTEAPEQFTAGVPCDVLGWVVSEGAMRSPVDESVWSFWLDPNGQGHIASVKESLPARMAIAGFSGLLREGKVLPKAGGPLHPRTALGLDAAGRRLTLVVVDGRQAGFSEGMSEYELAELLAGLGCQDALNLDGGGSSVMLMADPEGKLQIVNRPSESSGPRSVPVMIGVRKSLKKSDDSR